MDNHIIIAEAFGAIAVVFNFIGYRQQDINRYRLISAIALAAVSTHFFMLEALAAGIGLRCDIGEMAYLRFLWYLTLRFSATNGAC